MTNKQAAVGLREATAKEEAKIESKTGHDLARALIASKNAQKVPMEKAQKKNKQGECRQETRRDVPSAVTSEALLTGLPSTNWYLCLFSQVALDWYFCLFSQVASPPGARSSHGTHRQPVSARPVLSSASARNFSCRASRFTLLVRPLYSLIELRNWTFFRVLSSLTCVKFETINSTPSKQQKAPRGALRGYFRR